MILETGQETCGRDIGGSCNNIIIIELCTHIMMSQELEPERVGSSSAELLETDISASDVTVSRADVSAEGDKMKEDDTPERELDAGQDAPREIDEEAGNSRDLTPSQVEVDEWEDLLGNGQLLKKVVEGYKLCGGGDFDTIRLCGVGKVCLHVLHLSLGSESGVVGFLSRVKWWISTVNVGSL